MKAAVATRFGSPDVIEIQEVVKPVPRDHEVLIQVHAVALNPLDWRLMRGGPFLARLLLGGSRPRISSPGIDVAGRIEAVGRAVNRFQVGNDVFGSCRKACAEFACAPETALALKGDTITFEQAASANIAGLTALQALRDKARVRPGQKVLVNGAAGGVGTFAVQIARWMGAEVTGVCSTGNVELVCSLGAQHVIDYTVEDFTRGGTRYDVMVDCIANHSLRALGGVLSRGGICLSIGAPHDITLTRIVGRLAPAPFLSMATGRKFPMFVARKSSEDLAFLAGQIASGEIRPVIERRYHLEETAEALRYLEAGHARGKVIVTI